MGGPSIASQRNRREADSAAEEYDRDPEHERERGGDLSRSEVSLSAVATGVNALPSGL
jgi:hypothetical protein